ncbi:family transcriptional regulator [Micractinium conductrix]|uniref:Family transcriptional regulator n=1 Tax=Micractinium conductrix TaxID=554055 RepID=A0A2P6VFD1_9CHLO|nr:family transcriptional regulator [Micractinium conductrix]|eukprot:PSC72788.1 family transcriptional regulator [Micractinium conductrix]
MLQACDVSLQDAQHFKVKVLACPDAAARLAHCFEVHNAVATGQPEAARAWVKAVLAG